MWITVMFLSAVWTLILTAPIHCKGSICEQVMYWHFSKSVLMKKQTHLHFGFRDWGWVHFPQNVMFGWTIALTAFEKFIKL